MTTNLSYLHDKVLLDAMTLVILAEESEEATFTDVQKFSDNYYTGYNPRTKRRQRIKNPTAEQKAQAETSFQEHGMLSQLLGIDTKQALDELARDFVSPEEQKVVFGDYSKLNENDLFPLLKKNWQEGTKAIWDSLEKNFPDVADKITETKTQLETAINTGKEAVEEFVANSRLNLEVAKKNLALDYGQVAKNGIKTSVVAFAALILGNIALRAFVTLPIYGVVTPLMCANPTVLQIFGGVSVLAGLYDMFEQVDKRNQDVKKALDKIREDVKKQIQKEYKKNGLEITDKQLNILATNLTSDRLSELKF